MIIKNIDHLVLTTQNLKVFGEFYAKLGFKIENNITFLNLKSNNFLIRVHKKGAELFPHAQNISMGSADLCFEVEDLNLAKKLLDLNKIEVELGPIARMGAFGHMHSVYVRDPEKNLIELCCYDKK